MVLPSVESLRCFVAATETLNFRSASKKVALTPAALGQRIRQLEDQLGTPLFVRTTRSVAITRAGLELLPYAQRALAVLEDCGRAAHQRTAPAAMQIVVGTRHELGMSWLFPLLDRLEAASPGTAIHLYFGSGEDLLARIRTREVDCAVTSTRFVDPKLDGIRLHCEEYAFVAARALLEKHPLARAEDARAHTLIDSGPEMQLYHYWREAPGGGDRLRFQHIRYLGTIAAIERAVTSGLGVAVLPRYLVAKQLASGRLREVFPATPLPCDYFRLLFRANDSRRYVYDAFAAEMLKAPLR